MAQKISEAKARALFLRNNLKPLVPFPGTQKPWQSKCLITGKIVSPTYGKVRDFGHRCSYCSGFKVDEIEASALMKNAGFKTLVSYPGGNKPWKSQCLKCRKIFSPQYTSVKLGFGCKYCTHKAVDPKDAIKAMRKRGFKTLEPFPGAIKPWKVQCLDCKRKFETAFHSLNTINRCAYCSGSKLDQSEVQKLLLKLKLKSLEPFPGAGSPWKMKCLRCNRIVNPSWSHLSDKKRNVKGCAFCSGKRVHMDDLVKLMSAKKLKPIGHFYGVSKPWLSKCLRCGKEVQPRISDLKRGQSGCVYCSGLRIEEKEAIKLANKNGFTPLVPYPGAKTGWECLCNICGQISKPNYTSMQQGINRCKFCATGGFDFNLPAIIYLISHSKLGAHKIGVAGAAKHNERLAKHARQGWTVYKHKEFKKGIDAFNLEGKILHWLRYQKNLPPYLSIEQMPQAGWSETVDASEIDLPTIWSKVEELSQKRIKRR
jgi:DNA-directed RNA polymerase subunit RPC12/RpoP